MNFKEVTNRWPGDVTPMNQAGDIFQMEGQKTSFFFWGGAGIHWYHDVFDII